MLAFGKWPKKKRTRLIDDAIHAGVDFLLSKDPAKADYPTRTGDKPSRNWWKFGFPVFYVTDLLQNVEALVALGYGKDPRLKSALALIQDKQDAQGRWAMDYDYTGKTWLNFGATKRPNQWVTLRARISVEAPAAGANRYGAVTVTDLELGRQHISSFLLYLMMGPSGAGLFRWPVPDVVESIQIEDGQAIIHTK